MQARDKHALPALAPLVYTLGIIAGGLIGGSSAGAFGFAWGALAGSVLGPFLLPLIGALKGGLRWRWTLSLRHPDLKTYLLRSLPIMIGFSIVVVDDWYLKREGTVIGPGGAATLSYAKTLMKVPMGVFGLAAGVAVFPTLQRLVARGDVAGMRATLVRSLRNLLVISFAAQAVLSTCGDDVVALIYGRTRLGPEQVHEIAVCLSLVSIGLSAWAAQTLIARGFYALGNTWMPALLGTVVAGASYPLYVLARERWGVRGLAVASSCAIVAYTLILFWRLERRIGQHITRRGRSGCVHCPGFVRAGRGHRRGEPFGSRAARARSCTRDRTARARARDRGVGRVLRRRARCPLDGSGLDHVVRRTAEVSRLVRPGHGFDLAIVTFASNSPRG